MILRIKINSVLRKNGFYVEMVFWETFLSASEEFFYVEKKVRLRRRSFIDWKNFSDAGEKAFP